ncbi:MAG: tetratricopeptide repeat protein [Verrucomicrobia bacterium]|nr:tetratricopeptide repeat protein [Verrucomicrobiota bacterium]
MNTRLPIFLLLLLASTLFAGPPKSKSSQPLWAVADAPYRVILKLAAAPEIPEAGIEINLPEFGQTRPDLGDLLLTDKDGNPQPLARIGRLTGGRIVLLAQKMEPDALYFLYFGGDKTRALPDWTPKISLLMETRPAPPNLNFDSLQSLKYAWAQSQEPPGAGFFPTIYRGGNPFGPNVNFLSHYSGYLRLPKARDITFYTLSSDCSFVVVNDQEQFGWPGRHTPETTPARLAKKTISCPEGLVKIDYYAAKGDLGPEGRLEAATVLGWQTDTGFEAIPAESWVHPGSSKIVAIQRVDKISIPMIRASVDTFAAYSGQWFYETRFEVRPPLLAKEWEATWQFEDGATVTGSSGARLLTGSNSQLLKCTFTRTGTTINEVFRIDIPDRLQRASINDPGEVQRYLGMILAEDCSKLTPETIRPRLTLLCEYGADRDIARFAEYWRDPTQTDGLWMPTRLAALRALAQTDPVRAKQAFYELTVSLQPTTRKIYLADLTTAELDLLVYFQRDADAFGRLTQLSFLNPDLSRLIKIRTADLHRLLGHYKEAAEMYKNLGEKKNDLALPVKDSAASIAIRDLLDRGFSKEAQYKLVEWELRRPMVKFDSDYLLLRARAFMCFGRWSEALAELESFQKVQPDSPFQIDAQYYLARIRYEKGSKEEARKMWTDFAKDYPRHPLTPQAKEWAKKP